MNFKSKIVKNHKIIEQLWFILLMVSFFNVSAFISLSVNKKYYIKNMIPVFLIWCITIFIGYYIIRYVWKKATLKDFREVLFDHRYLVIVVVISTIIRIPMLGTLPKWDAGEYYFRLGTACNNYDFTFKSFFENFRLCNHSNLGFSFFYAIAEFLSPRNQVGVLCLNLVMTELAIVCVYILVREYWLNVSDKIVALTTFVVSCTPIFLGTFAYFNVDYFLLLAFIFMVYFEYKQQNIWMAFWAVILSQTKETGVVLVAAYLGSKMIVGLIQAKEGVGQRIKAVCRKPYTWAALTSGLLYVIEIKLIGSVTGWTQMGDSESPIHWSNTGFNCFGFNVDYILFKLKQLCILNFSWIIGIIFAVCAIFLGFQLKRVYRDRAHRLIYIIIVMAAYTVFSILYITYTLPRYNIFFSVLFTLFTVCMLYVVIGHVWSGRLYISVMSVLGGLFFIQAFWNIDVLASKCFETIDIGNGHNMIFSSYQKGYYGDGLVTNYQYAWIDRVENKMLQAVNFDGQSMVIEPQDERSAYIAGNMAAYYLSWDEKNKTRHIDESGNVIQYRTPENIYTSFPYRMYEYNNIADVAKHAVMYFLPYYHMNETDELKKVADVCYVGPRKTVTSYGGECVYYELVRKSNYRNLNIEDFIGNQVKKKKDINCINDLYDEMKNEGWNIERVQEYYEYLLCQSSEEKEYKHKKTAISKYDKVTMDIAVYMEDADILEEAEPLFDGKYENMLVGCNILLPEIDQALNGAEIDEKVAIEWKVPQDYNALYEYRGKTLHVVLTPREITGHIEPDTISYEAREKIYEQAFNVVWNYYMKKVLKSVTMASYNSNVYTQVDLEKQRKKIDKYYINYFKTIHIDEKDFLDNYAHISNEDFDQAKEDMAKARCAWKYWKRRFSQYDKIMHEKLYNKGLNNVLLKKEIE